MVEVNLNRARMEWANLRAARMVRAILFEARMGSTTDLTNAVLHGARVWSVDFSDVPLSLVQIDQMFGDGTVTLPEGVTRPAHWPDWKLDSRDFITEWRKWQADPENYTPPKPDQLT